MKFTKLLDKLAPTDKISFSEGWERIIASLERRRAKTEIAYYPTGFDDLDEIGGIPSIGLTYIVGRPGSCKSLLILIIAFNMAVIHGIAVLIISSEMENIDYMERLVSFYTKIDFDRVLKGVDLTDEEMQQIKDARKAVENSPLRFAFNTDIDLKEFRKLVTYHKEVYKTKVFFVDYFQLLTSGENIQGGETPELAYVSKTLRKWALDWRVPLVLLAQATQEVDKRKNKRPLLSDIGYTGQASKDAFAVWGLYNEESAQQEASENKGLLEITQLKSRKSKPSRVMLRYDGNTQSLMNNNFNDEYSTDEKEDLGLIEATEEDEEEMDFTD